MAISDFYNNLIDVYSPTNPKALSGGMKVTPSLKAAGVACRITDDNAGQEVVADGKNIKVSHTIYTDYTGFVNGDAVIETSPGASLNRLRFLGPKFRRAAGSIPQFGVFLFTEMQN